MPRNNAVTVAPPGTHPESALHGAAIVENGLSRIWLGVHWQFDAVFKNKNIGGIPLAKDTAKKPAAQVALRA